MNTYKLEIITPEKQFFCGEVEATICPLEDGDLEVLKGHEAMVAALKEDEIRLKINGEWKTAVISDGFFEVRPDEVVIFAIFCEWQEDYKTAAEKRRAERERLEKLARETSPEQQINSLTLAKIIMSGRRKNTSVNI